MLFRLVSLNMVQPLRNGSPSSMSPLALRSWYFCPCIATVFSLTKVQVTFAPELTLIALVGLGGSSSQVWLFKIQPGGTISVTLKIPVTLTLSVILIPSIVVRLKSPSPVTLDSKSKSASPPIVSLTILSRPVSTFVNIHTA